jgi:UDPglucose--hexose-1-phosphate uridylyltransferase
MSTSETRPQICLDPLSKTSVFLAPRRGERPIELGESDDSARASEQRSRCPFCLGNEQLAPPDVLRLPAGSAWQARVVPNRYPIVSDPTGLPADGDAPDSTRPACGIHEVLIESPLHDTRVEQVASETWATAWRAARERLEALAGTPQLRWAMLFKNAGLRAGASLAHVHSQLVGLDFVPPVVQEKTDRLREEPQLHDRVIDDARREGRIWAEACGLVAFVPSAARQPFEICIMPCTAEAHFHSTSAASVTALAELTHQYARRLSELTDKADYNWWLHQPAFRDSSPAVGWHWHLEIMPRLTQLAGFELGSGCHISTMPPAYAAALLAG